MNYCVSVKPAHLYTPTFMRVYRTGLFWSLFFFMVSISQNVFARSELKDKGTVADEGEVPLREVEAGPAGNIELERKYRTKAESQYEWHAHLLWESRYVTEGRDNLSGKRLLSASTEFSLDEFSIIPWVADGVGIDYSEFNLNIVNSSRLAENLVLYLGYSFVHARELGARTNDNEISLDLAYKLMAHVNALVSFYHSFDAKGSFMEVAVKYNNAINQQVHYSVQGVLGVNAEYVPDGHNGFNHFQLLANASYRPAKPIELYTYLGYNLAINRDAIKYAGDELLGDFVLSGVGLSYLF